MIIDKTEIDASRRTHVASILWIHTMSHKDKWNLSSEEIADLLGLPIETYQDILQKIKKKETIDLNANTLERLSLLLGIWKCLQLIAPTDRIDLAYSTFSQPIANETFNSSIKEFLLVQNEIKSFHLVRRYLEGAVN